MKCTHEDETPFTKEEFLQKLKTDREFNNEFGNKGIDQISDLIKQIKENPDSRRLLVSAWNPADLPHQILPPCHYGFQVYTRELSLEEKWEWLNKNYTMYELGEWTLEKLSDSDYLEEVEVEYNIPTRAISLMWSQRSCDFPLGIPANIMSYALLLMMLSKQVNMVPDELIGNLGDCHIYFNQIDGVKEQITREPLPLPNVILSDRVVNDLFEYIHTDIILENYQSHPKIYFPLSN
jgi:thymidylate synthase